MPITKKKKGGGGSQRWLLIAGILLTGSPESSEVLPPIPAQRIEVGPCSEADFLFITLHDFYREVRQVQPQLEFIRTGPFDPIAEEAASLVDPAHWSCEDGDEHEECAEGEEAELEWVLVGTRDCNDLTVLPGWYSPSCAEHVTSIQVCNSHDTSEEELEVFPFSGSRSREISPFRPLR